MLPHSCFLLQEVSGLRFGTLLSHPISLYRSTIYLLQLSNVQILLSITLALDYISLSRFCILLDHATFPG